MTEDAYLIDKMFIKGVCSRRSQNDSNMDYVLEKKMEPEGLHSYVHKYMLG